MTVCVILSDWGVVKSYFVILLPIYKVHLPLRQALYWAVMHGPCACVVGLIYGNMVVTCGQGTAPSHYVARNFVPGEW